MLDDIRGQDAGIVHRSWPLTAFRHDNLPSIVLTKTRLLKYINKYIKNNICLYILYVLMFIYIICTNNKKINC